MISGGLRASGRRAPAGEPIGHATGTATEKRLMKINERTAETASDLQLRLGGAKGTRTPDPLLAKQVLFQLSYSPSVNLVPPTRRTRAGPAPSRWTCHAAAPSRVVSGPRDPHAGWRYGSHPADRISRSDARWRRRLGSGPTGTCLTTAGGYESPNSILPG